MKAAAVPLDVPWWAWLVFAIVVVASLTVDLVVHRGDHALGRRQAFAWSGAWIAVSLLFAGWVALTFGGRVSLEFLTAYLVEKSLSVDNLFVFAVIFGGLKVPRTEQHRVLFWGIIGAFATRALFIVAGTAILARWHVVVYALGAFVLYTGIKTLRTSPEIEENAPRKDGRVLAFFKRHLRLTTELHGHRFLVREAGGYVATPLLLALLGIEIADILFAVDSIAAVLAISPAPFIVFSSNVFAILGLRALYLVLVDVLSELRYLHLGVGGVLVFIGAKMLAARFVAIPSWASLFVTVAILAAAVVPSLVTRRRSRRHAPA